MKPFIVKVQVSLFASKGIPQQVLIYNRERDIQWQGEASKEILELMKGENKKYFYATLVDTKINLSHEADWQKW